MICLPWELFLDPCLDSGHERVVRGKFDVFDVDGRWFVEIGFALEDGVSVNGDGSPSVFRHRADG
jgi:hypothetical protein